MSRHWSESARSLRFVRAAAKGYLTTHSGPNKKFVEVPRSLAPAISAAARSMEYHARHDQLTGEHHHFARIATESAKEHGLISPV